MKSEQHPDHLKIFTATAIEVLKELAAQGKELTPDTFYDGLSLKPDIRRIDQKLRQAEALAGTVNPELEKLKTRLEKNRFQKDQLLKQLTQAEEVEFKTQHLHKRLLPTLIDLVRDQSGDKEIAQTLALLRSLCRKGAGVAQLEVVFTQLRDHILKSGVAPATAKPAPAKAPGLFAKWRKTAPAGEPQPDSEPGTAMQQVRETYVAIVADLRLNLDQPALKSLNKIERQIRAAEDMTDFFSVRHSILALIQVYITRISGERQQATLFIREIGERLGEIEQYLFDSVSLVQATNKSNKYFSATLEDQLSELSGTIDFSQTLADLKNTMVTRIAAIKQAVAKKKTADQTLMQKAEKQVGLLKANLKQMKNKIDTAQQRADSLAQELLIDSLTGIYNRRAYDRRIIEEFKRYQRHQRAFSLLLFDVDHFKQINDTYGHAVGDLCLQEIVRRIRPLLRESDLLARYGGEEFIVILPETGRQGAMDAAEKLRNEIARTEFIHKKDKLSITISLGVTEADPEDKSIEAMFGRIDEAMYQAKKTGRNRVVSA